ncbi:DUF2589 domain-containing protein [Dysgonomonas sp. 520]|uniref:DUF2589 domain-containing protein n=1 Tax=Dysgonomonas sp. 520 TaxID=2302931 RepID=UPI002105E586|nr:DUF2589 domain-containing protein [Dysgonomonas sp. 520]
MLTFSYDISDNIGDSHKQTVSIPLLTLVTLPLLQVKEADFEFDIHIVDAVSEEQKQIFSLQKGKVIRPENAKC